MSTLTTIRPELLRLSQDQVGVLTPYFLILSGIILAILASVLKIFSPKWPVFILVIAACGAGVSESFRLLDQSPVLLFNGMMISDTYSNFFNILFLLAALFTSIISFRYLDREKLQHPEYFILLLFSALGMMLMASSLDLIVIFIALELMSIAVYVLVGFRRADRRSNEAAMKYFILGSAASAILLYGVALIYGATGHTQLKMIFTVMQIHPESTSPVFMLGAILVLIGFLFKVSCVPFHMWMPDVYEGAPIPVTGFMATGLKAAAFATLVRVFITMGYGRGLSEILQHRVHDLLWVSAVLTMGVGSFVGLTQTNLKRLLAYSSIGHSGYLLIGVIAGSKSDLSFAPGVFYLSIYAVMNLGVFIVLGLLSSRDDSGLNIHDLAGLSRRHPWIAFSLAVFILAMAGIPPTSGFVAKYLLFYSAIQADEIILTIIAVLCSAVSVYYYLRILVYMYMMEPMGSPRLLRVPLWTGFTVAAMVVFTIHMGILPAGLVDLARKAITSL